MVSQMPSSSRVAAIQDNICTIEYQSQFDQYNEVIEHGIIWRNKGKYFHNTKLVSHCKS